MRAGRQGRARLGRVAIVGAGQIGTALGLALRRGRPAAAVDVGVLDSDRSVAERSLARGAADRVLSGDAEVLDCDTVVLATPVPEIVRWLERLGARLRPGSFLIDTGSTKAPVVDAMSVAVPATVHAVGGHPLAGTERPGPGGATPRLLRGAAFVLTPVREDPHALALGRGLAAAVGARPVVLEAAVHDRALARTSHLAHVTSFALAWVAGAAEGAGGGAGELASGGFDGATRLARSDPRMVAGFLSANADNLLPAIRDLQDRLGRMATALTGPEELARLLAAAQTAGDGDRLPTRRYHRSR